jgi:hypothetical protein
MLHNQFSGKDPLKGTEAMIFTLKRSANHPCHFDIGSRLYTFFVHVQFNSQCFKAPYGYANKVQEYNQLPS